MGSPPLPLPSLPPPSPPPSPPPPSSSASPSSSSSRVAASEVAHRSYEVWRGSRPRSSSLGQRQGQATDGREKALVGFSLPHCTDYSFSSCGLISLIDPAEDFSHTPSACPSHTGTSTRRGGHPCF